MVWLLTLIFQLPLLKIEQGSVGCVRWQFALTPECGVLCGVHGVLGRVSSPRSSPHLSAVRDGLY